MIWYHISRTWKYPREIINPRVIRADDGGNLRDLKPAIAVCPSLAQCVVAIGAWYDYPIMRIYQTQGSPIKADWVFDFELTSEHRFYQSQIFNFVKEIRPLDLIKQGIPVVPMCGISDTRILKNGIFTLNALINIKL